MRDFEIVEGIDEPVKFYDEDINHLIDEAITDVLFEDFNDFLCDEEGSVIVEKYEELCDVLEKNIKEAIDYYTNTDGYVYIDDWSEFTERYITHTKEQING